MSFRYVPSNLLAAATLFSAPTAASGYSSSALTDGIIGVIFRTNATGTTWNVVLDRGASPSTLNFGAVFGLKSKALGPGNITSVFLADSPDNVTYHGFGSVPLNSRGDGFEVLAGGSAQKYFRLQVLLASADVLDVAELFAGISVDLIRSPMGPLARGRTYPTKLSDAEDGSLYTSQRADRYEDWDFAWGSLSSSQATEIETMFDASSGPAQPLVVVPDTIGAEVFHGHWTTQRIQRQVDAPTVSGIRLQFRESGRPVYA